MGTFDDLIGHGVHAFLNFRIVDAATDEALGRIDGVGGVGYRLTFGKLPDQTFPRFRYRHNGRGGFVSGSVGDDDRFSVFYNGDTGVGRSQVDTECIIRHGSILLFRWATATGHMPSKSP